MRFIVENIDRSIVYRILYAPTSLDVVITILLILILIHYFQRKTIVNLTDFMC